jgi:DNA polymerase III epsilon subunit family exonuclease
VNDNGVRNAAPGTGQPGASGTVADGVAGSAAGTVAGRVPLPRLDYVVVDVETTGWAPADSGITEIGAVRVHGGQVVAEFTSLVNPGTPVPPDIAELTGIDDEMLTGAPSVAAVLPGLLAFADGCVLTAHNARFDLSFLTAACEAAGMAWPGFPVLDTVRLARYLMAVPDEVPDCKLGTLAGFFGSPAQPSHRALADARATADVLMHLVGRLAERGVVTLDDLTLWLAERDAAELARAREAQRAATAELEAARRLAAAAAHGRWPRWLRWLPRAAGSLLRSLRPGGQRLGWPDSVCPWLPR